MGEHIIDGKFQSDKYPKTPRGLIPFKVTDPMAQDLLYVYAQRRRKVDAVFADDVVLLLREAGYEPSEFPEEKFWDLIQALSAPAVESFTAMLMPKAVAEKIGHAIAAAVGESNARKWDSTETEREALETLRVIRDFTWRKVLCWQGFDNPAEVQANTDIVQIWQLLNHVAPDNSSDKERDRRANAIGERVRSGEFEQIKAALTASAPAGECTCAERGCYMAGDCGGKCGCNESGHAAPAAATEAVCAHERFTGFPDDHAECEDCPATRANKRAEWVVAESGGES